MKPLPQNSSSLNNNERLGAYVIKTRADKNSAHASRVWLNTITGQTLPLDADLAALRSGFFLADQQYDAMLSRIFETRETLTLTAIVTWRCNLRCTHCTVISRLARNDCATIDPERLAGFIRRFREARPNLRRLKLSLLGGEPLLNTELCRSLVDSTYGIIPQSLYDITTNGALRVERPQIELLRKMQDITVSLDGPEAANNTQRKAYRASFNPYERTIAFIEELCANGLADKILVQGAIRDEFSTLENMADFFRVLMAAGVRYDRIHFGSIHPTRSSAKVQQSFCASLGLPNLRHQACCKFRGGHNLVIDSDGTVISDYYDWERLGTLDDSIEDLAHRHRRMTVDTMPALSDSQCRKCPVVGYCWGGCTNARPLVGMTPSAHCNPQALMSKVREMADAGSLPMGANPTSRTDECGATGRSDLPAADQTLGSAETR